MSTANWTLDRACLKRALADWRATRPDIETRERVNEWLMDLVKDPLHRGKMDPDHPGRWASKALGTEVPDLGTAVFIAALNDSLELHQLLPQLDDERELREVARVLGERTHLLPN